MNSSKRNRCGDCVFIITDGGKPYYCAIRELYTFVDEADEACDDYEPDNEE